MNDRIHDLWDEFADFDAAGGDAALDHLPSGWCSLAGALMAIWLGQTT